MMFVLQCMFPGEEDWADLYYDTRSPDLETADIVLTAKRKMIEGDELFPRGTRFQIIRREFEKID